MIYNLTHYKFLFSKKKKKLLLYILKFLKKFHYANNIDVN